jgi:hypothetical protein
MSSATVRAKRPPAASRTSKSRAEPGLPWMKTIASRARRGPASTTRVATPSTLRRLVRAPGGSGSSPSRTECSASLAMPSGPPSGVQ